MFSHGVYTRWEGSSNNKRVRAERRGGINGLNFIQTGLELDFKDRFTLGSEG